MSRAGLELTADRGSPAIVLPLAPPASAGAAGSEIRDFRAVRVEPEEDGAVLVSACVATPIPGWVEDMRPPVVARAHAFTAKLAERALGAPVELRGRAEDVEDVVAVAGDGRSLGVARTWIGFEHDRDTARLLTCGATCTRAAGPPGPLACEAVVRTARLVGDAPPPGPGAALAAVAAAVHHPTATAAWAGALAAMALVVAVAVRRRPRFRG